MYRNRGTMIDEYETFLKTVCINCSSACDRSEEFIRQCFEELNDSEDY